MVCVEVCDFVVVKGDRPFAACAYEKPPLGLVVEAAIVLLRSSPVVSMFAGKLTLPFPLKSAHVGYSKNSRSPRTSAAARTRAMLLLLAAHATDKI